jgi:UDP-3-O-[3-hydroxymyristoyl] N-acetylglucosamine deacetylase
LIKQTTVAAPININGIGLHTAVIVNLRILPAPPDTGYVFVRTDLSGFEIPATIESVAHCSYATTLMRTGVMLSTVEHLLSALRGMGVDNAYLEVDDLELPIMDGSSQTFTELINLTGLVEQPAMRKALRVKEKVIVEQDNRSISIEPWDGYEIDCTIDFPHPMIGVQSFKFDVLDHESYRKAIAPARTFGFTNEIDELRRANLIRGGSPYNAIVLTPDGILNDTGLRFKDEFVRHKVLDIIGDLALIGVPLLGRVVAKRSGHILHTALLTKLLRNSNAWEIVDMPVHEEDLMLAV